MSAHLKMYTEVTWPLIGFVIFFVLFLLFVASTYLKSQIRIHAHLQNLPFEDQEKEFGHEPRNR